MSHRRGLLQSVGVDGDYWPRVARPPLSFELRKQLTLIVEGERPTRSIAEDLFGYPVANGDTY
jgi:hypothetical protein